MQTQQDMTRANARSIVIPYPGKNTPNRNMTDPGKNSPNRNTDWIGGAG